MSYESHRLLLDSALETYVQRKKQLEQELRELKETHRERIISIITCDHNDPGTIDLLASYAYVFNGNVDSTTLGSLLSKAGKSGSYSMVKHIKKFGLQKPCSECGNIFEFNIDSRTNNIKFNKYGQPTKIGSWHKRRCDKCESANRQEYDEQQKINVEKSKQYYAEIELLKTMPYDEYLKTDHWEVTRKRALGRVKYKCQLCSKNGELHVHHKTYARRGNEWSTDLIVLCKNCHAKFHDKLEPEEVTS